MTVVYLTAPLPLACHLVACSLQTLYFFPTLRAPLSPWIFPGSGVLFLYLSLHLLYLIEPRIYMNTADLDYNHGPTLFSFNSFCLFFIKSNSCSCSRCSFFTGFNFVSIASSNFAILSLYFFFSCSNAFTFSRSSLISS